MYTNKYLYESKISEFCDNIFKRSNLTHKEFIESKSDIKKIDKLTTNENRIIVYSKLDTIRASLSNSNCKYKDKIVDLIDNINIRNSQLIRNTYLKNINGPITKILKGDLKYLGSKIDSLKNKDNLSVMQKIQLKLLKTEKNFTQKYLYPASINKPSSINLKNISKMQTYRKYIKLLQNQDENVEYFSNFINTQLNSCTLLTPNEKKDIREIVKNMDQSDIYEITLKKQSEMIKHLHRLLKNEQTKAKAQKIKNTIKQVSYDPYLECIHSCLQKTQFTNEDIRLCVRNCYFDAKTSPRERAQQVIALLQQEELLTKNCQFSILPEYTFEISRCTGDLKSYKFEYYDKNEMLIKSSLYSIPDMNAQMNIRSSKITKSKKCKIIDNIINDLTEKNSGRDIISELKINLNNELNYDSYIKLNPYILYMLKEENLIEYAKAYISHEISPIGYKSPVVFHKESNISKVKKPTHSTNFSINSNTEPQSSYIR